MFFYNFKEEEFPNVFNESVGVVNNILRSNSNIYKICNPIAAEFAKSRLSGGKKFTKDQLINAVEATLLQKISIERGPDNGGVVLQMNPETMTLILNDRYTTFEASATTIEYKRCKLLLITKILHATFHALTSTFWSLSGFPQELRNDGTFWTMGPPLRMGTSYGSGKQMTGDTGYAFEETHFGGRILDCPLTGYFSPLMILVPERILRKSKSYIISDERVLEVLATLEKGEFNKHTNLSLFSVGLEPLNYPVGVRLVESAVAGSKLKNPLRSTGSSSSALQDDPSHKKARLMKSSSPFGEFEGKEGLENREEGLPTDAQLAAAESYALRGLNSSMIQRSDSGANYAAKWDGSNSEDEEDCSSNIRRQLTVAIHSGGFKS